MENGINNGIVPEVIKFAEKCKTITNNSDAEEELRNFICNISDEETSGVIIDSVVNGPYEECLSISEQIRILFETMFSGCKINKIEFVDEQQRRNFIDYGLLEQFSD